MFLPNYSLDIVGDGPEFPRLCSKVFELGLSHRVKFMVIWKVCILLTFE